MHYLPVYNISEIVAAKGIQHAVICPGSRNAPLTISFVRNSRIACYSVPDERSAGFIALGMAQKLQQPVAVICTSGTAALNLAPAIAEAYYQQIPLLVLTADRPPELINQRDGQAINQHGIYANYIKQSYTLLAENSVVAEFHTERVVNDAVNTAMQFPCGPVHINVPVREPFYPAKGEEITTKANHKIVKQYKLKHTFDKEDWFEVITLLEKYPRKLLVAGLLPPDTAGHLSSLVQNTDIVVIADITSNVAVKDSIKHYDTILAESNAAMAATFKPQLLITIGREVLSKNLKNFIRKNKPECHLHIEYGTEIVDTYHTLTHKLPLSAQEFFNELVNRTRIKTDKEYRDAWYSADIKAKKILHSFLKKAPFGEFSAMGYMLEAMPENVSLHFANSMPVRYASYIGIRSQEVYSNRGTSGIDGSTSTAVGSAKVSDKLTVLFTGDVSFFYDRNAFWNNILPANLRVVLLNNGGGGIFRIIDGPSGQKELRDFFETDQRENASSLAKNYGINYTSCHSLEELQNSFESFMKPNDKAAILEIFSSSENNAAVFEEFRKQMAELSK